MGSKYTDEQAKHLGRLIKREITRRGMKQAEFAEKLGISPSRLSNYIGGNRLPDIFTLKEMARELSISVDYLCGGDKGRASDVFPKVFELTIGADGFVSLVER